jgi:hypothetical protein
MTRGALVGIALALAPALARADDRSLGEACASHSDCRAGLRCLRDVCESDAAYASERLKAGGDFDKGTMGYVGFTFGGGLPTIWNAVGESGQVAVHVGALFEGHVQLQLEVSPATTVYGGLNNVALGSFDAVGTVGYLVPISDMVSWILRIGGGGGAMFGIPPSSCQTCGSSNGPIAGFGEFRLDVVGVAIRTSKHILLEWNGPSFRVMVFPSPGGFPNNSNIMLSWVSSVSVSYLF